MCPVRDQEVMVESPKAPQQGGEGLDHPRVIKTRDPNMNHEILVGSELGILVSWDNM